MLIDLSDYELILIIASMHVTQQNLVNEKDINELRQLMKKLQEHRDVIR